MQSRELSWMGRRFGELRLGNVRRPSARGSTRGPGSPRIAPGRNRGLPAGGTVSAQKASTLTLNAVATRGTDAAAPGRRSGAGLTAAARAGTAIVPFIYSPSSQNAKLPHSNQLEKFIQG